VLKTSQRAACAQGVKEENPSGAPSSSAFLHQMQARTDPTAARPPALRPPSQRAPHKHASAHRSHHATMRRARLGVPARNRETSQQRDPRPCQSP
jgi:hypothetical protein